MEVAIYSVVGRLRASTRYSPNTTPLVQATVTNTAPAQSQSPKSKPRENLSKMATEWTGLIGRLRDVLLY